MIRCHAGQKSIAALLVFATMGMTGCATTKMHPEFADRHSRMQKIAVLPPDTQVYEVTFNAGNKPLADLTEITNKHTAQALVKTLASKGYEVTPVAVEQKDLDANPALKEAVFNIQALYKKAAEDIAKNRKSSFTYDVGSSANYFAEAHGVNALVITRQVGSKLSDGTVAAQVVSTAASAITTALLGVSAGGGMTHRHALVTEIAVVDADLGDILWYHLGQTNENYAKADDSKPVEKLVELVLKALPDSKFKKPDAGAKAQKDAQIASSSVSRSGAATTTNFAAKRAAAAPSAG